MIQLKRIEVHAVNPIVGVTPFQQGKTEAAKVFSIAGHNVQELALTMPEQQAVLAINKSIGDDTQADPDYAANLFGTNGGFEIGRLKFNKGELEDFMEADGDAPGKIAAGLYYESDPVTAGADWKIQKLGRDDLDRAFQDLFRNPNDKDTSIHPVVGLAKEQIEKLREMQKRGVELYSIEVDPDSDSNAQGILAIDKKSGQATFFYVNLET